MANITPVEIKRERSTAEKIQAASMGKVLKEIVLASWDTFDDSGGACNIERADIEHTNGLRYALKPP